jgi:hypothetical protein
VTVSNPGGARASEALPAEPTDAQLLFGHTDDRKLIEAARRLVARRYLEQGYIAVSDINDSGMMTPEVDPYHSTSTYFVAVDGGRNVVATIRQVEYSPVRDMESFPFCAHLDLYEKSWRLLRTAGARDWVELSGLAKEPWIDTEVANRLYREMWARSFARGHQFWLIATHPLFARWLRGLFMTSVVKAGDPMQYLGSMTQPLIMHVSTALDGVCERYFNSSSPRIRRRCQATVEYFLDGIDAANFSPQQVRRFADMGVEFSLDLRDGSLAAASS